LHWLWLTCSKTVLSNKRLGDLCWASLTCGRSKCDQVAWTLVSYGPQLAASRRAVYKACNARKFASTGMQWVWGPYGLALPGTALQRLLASWSSPGLLHDRGRTLFARPIPQEELHLLGAQVGPARDAYPKTPHTSQTHLLEFPVGERHQ
jgi:hypothetical protein